MALLLAEHKTGVKINPIHLRECERKTVIQVRATKNDLSWGGQGSVREEVHYRHTDGESNAKVERKYSRICILSSTQTMMTVLSFHNTRDYITDRP